MDKSAMDTDPKYYKVSVFITWLGSENLDVRCKTVQDAQHIVRSTICGFTDCDKIKFGVSISINDLNFSFDCYQSEVKGWLEQSNLIQKWEFL